ncbi:MAG: hypothetical protein ACFFCY_10645 [Promethearchaeota archaeon]
MQTIPAKQFTVEFDDTYFQKFVANDGTEYGLRFGNANDAKAISSIFKEIYGYNYVNPLVYDIELLKKELKKENNFWFVGESLKTKEIAGAGLLQVERYIAQASKAVTKKKYQGKGITSKIGAAGIITVIKMPQFKNILRLDFEIRGSEIGAQKLAQYAGAFPYSLIPAYANFGDRRNFNIEDNKPFPPQREESVFLYSILFKNLWSKRDKKVFLLNNGDIIFFYEFVKKMHKKMKDDILILEDYKKDNSYELYGVSKDSYMGIVKLYGYIKKKSLNSLIRTYHDWRIILWRIPTTQNGIASMHVALNKGFRIVGYDIGFNNINWILYDSIILAYYPNNHRKPLKLNCLEINKPLLKEVNKLFEVKRVF